MRLVIICFRVSDPDNGTTDGGTEGGRAGQSQPGWHWHLAEGGMEGGREATAAAAAAAGAKLFFQAARPGEHAKEVRNGTAMQNARGMRNGSGS